jgi:hypothetical protein
MKFVPDNLLPQPPSFVKKKAYELQQVLGTGTFGKVVVRPFFSGMEIHVLHGSPPPFHDR